jgi:general nucleoside transport system permease protein
LPRRLPLIFAVIGETLSERAGVINLSMNGTILLSAMGGFAVAYNTENIVLGFLAGMLIGALVALIVAFASITLQQSQVAVGFVLADLPRPVLFSRQPYMGVPGPRLQASAAPRVGDLPILGQLFFRHDMITYISFLSIFLAWFWIFRTRPGLMLQGIGEKPAAAYIRGANVNLMRYVYTIIGGALIGLAGPAFSLAIRAGWMGTISGLDGFGWIALAITIFGGWNPVRGAFGAYLFAFLQWLGLVLAARADTSPFAGVAGCALPADDPHAFACQYRQRRMGGAHPRRHARICAQDFCENSASHAHVTARGVGCAVRTGLIATSELLGTRRFSSIRVKLWGYEKFHWLQMFALWNGIPARSGHVYLPKGWR